jgi:uncharacterized membrane protein
MKHSQKLLLLWAAIGAAYCFIEGLWRPSSNGAWMNIFMLPVGALGGVAIGLLNQIPKFFKMRVIWQTITGALIFLVVEFAAGCAMNLWWGMNLWDYSNLPTNIMGQTCLLHMVFWFFLIPFMIWAEDYIRHLFWKQGKLYSLGRIYIEVFTLRRKRGGKS